ncbi:hypothetical protein ACIBI4_21390 [Streptomyces sp. NPDC050418]|uniref:hypothetical protein n=1 Tax=Streptomyces sp. NPDC050418 TaxID=3365612 RepID=UPI0037B62509
MPTTTAAGPLRARLATLRGPDAQPKPLDARALAALAANPGCRRRALLDGAGVDKTKLAEALGVPSGFGQSQFAFIRGNAFEARVKGDGGAELLRLAHQRLGGPEPTADTSRVPELTASGPEGRAARTELALREAESGVWTLLDHPMVALDVAGSPAFLEPDAVVVHPDGRWTVVEIKSFPMIDGSADAAKVGAAARQAAVYVLALEQITARLDPAPEVGHDILLVCPKDFSNLPTASAVDVRRQRAVTRRQLDRLTRIEDIAAALAPGATFALEQPAEQLTATVESVPATYAPECLSACELAFHCRDRARGQGAVTALGRSLRGDLGELTTVDAVLAAAHGESGDPDDPAVAALRRAAALRAEALASVSACTAPAPRSAQASVDIAGEAPDIPGEADSSVRDGGAACR